MAKARIKKIVSTKAKRASIGKLVFQQPADIVLNNSSLRIQGSKIQIFGSTNNLIASFDSKTNKFTVSNKLVIGTTDVGNKLQELENRITTLES